MRFIDKIPVIFRRVVTIGILSLIVVFIGLGVLARCNKVEDPPAVIEAPWAIQTNTRIFYAKEFKTQNKVPMIRNYWTFDGKRYTYKEEVIEFDKATWGEVVIVKRMEK